MGEITDLEQRDKTNKIPKFIYAFICGILYIYLQLNTQIISKIINLYTQNIQNKLV